MNHPITVTVTCQVDGCMNAGVPILTTMERGGVVICGPCGNEIQDIAENA